MDAVLLRIFAYVMAETLQAHTKMVGTWRGDEGRHAQNLAARSGLL